MLFIYSINKHMGERLTFVLEERGTIPTFEQALDKLDLPNTKDAVVLSIQGVDSQCNCPSWRRREIVL